MEYKTAQQRGIGREIRDSMMIVKGRFKGAALNLYGQFILIFKNDGLFESFNAVVSSYSDLYNLEPHAEWTAYREFIANAKWKGNFNANLTTSIMDQFKKFSEEMNSLSLFYQSVCEYDYNSIDITLYDLINRIVHDKHLNIETAIQEVSNADFRLAMSAPPSSGQSAEPAADQGAQDESFSVDEDAVILPIKPIVAPVKGKPIYELRIGDKLLVYIEPKSDRANYFIDLLSLREDNEVRPTAAEVIDIKTGTGRNDPVDILTLITKGLYGKFTETEKQVKLRLYNPEIDGPLARKPAGKKGPSDERHAEGSKTGFSKSTIFMLVLLMAMLSLFIVLIILNL